MERTMKRPGARIAWLAVLIGTAAGLAVATGTGHDAATERALAQSSQPGAAPSPLPTSIPACNAAENPVVRFAVVGDFGICAGSPLGKMCEAEKAVAQAIVAANPDFVLAVGDTNYQFGCAATLPGNILNSGGTSLYESFVNAGRYFPVLGNHEYLDTPGTCPGEAIGSNEAEAHLRAFGTEKFFELRFGHLNIYGLDVNKADEARGRNDQYDINPDHAPPLADQKDFLAERLRQSKACWNMVFLHHPPYSSGGHGDHTLINDVGGWNYESLAPGAKRVDAVFAGHDHNFEYLKGPAGSANANVDYFVSGAGGNVLTRANQSTAGRSQLKAEGEFGFLLVTVKNDSATYVWNAVGTGDIGSDQRFTKFDSTAPTPVLTQLAAELGKDCATLSVARKCPPYGPITPLCQWNGALPVVTVEATRPECTPLLPGPPMPPRQFFPIDPPRPAPGACGQAGSVMGVRIKVELCCTLEGHQPPFDRCYWQDTGAAARIKAFIGGVEVREWFPSTYTNAVGTVTLDTTCIFDPFNLPDHWEVEIYGPWSVRKSTYETYCCNCIRPVKFGPTPAPSP